jgi:hypothetical protein
VDNVAAARFAAMHRHPVLLQIACGPIQNLSRVELQDPSKLLLLAFTQPNYQREATIPGIQSSFDH